MTTARITITKNGPYVVSGELPAMTRRRPVAGADGHPRRWEDHATLDPAATCDDAGTVALCRCGRSNDKPFCDGSHRSADFDGTESAPTTTYQQRATVLGGVGVQVRDDRSICEHAGLCTNAATNVWKLAKGDATADPAVREAMIAMVEHCPSGALTHRSADGATEVEPDLEVAIGVIDDGPLSITGGIPVTRSDGVSQEVRNRMTLCRCGASKNKPLCDGSHAETGFADR